MAYNGRGVAVLSDPIRWWSDIGKIQHGGALRLMWHDGRLWLSLEAGPNQAATRWLFLWDAAGKTFTRYDRLVDDLYSWSKTGEDADPLFLEVDSTDLFRYDRTYIVDIDSVGESFIDGYYRTAWFTADETASLKRFKRPRVTAAANQPATIRVEVYQDFNDLAPARFADFAIDVPPDASLWGTMNWGDDWYVASDEYYAFVRLPSSGTARAVSYRFSAPSNLGRWWVDSITIPFRRKAIK
jgi:hypothetical protein